MAITRAGDATPTSARATASASCARALAPARRSASPSYGEAIDLNGVRVSLHPAGHILGSAQVRIEYRGEVWVVSGDYKTEPDSTCTPFEPLRCHTFVTESTFGLPIYRWSPEALVLDEIRAWWRSERADGARVGALCLRVRQGAARTRRLRDADIGPIYTHGAIERLNRDYRDSGVSIARHDLRECIAARSRLLEWTRPRATVRRRVALAAALRRHLDRIRVGLDAHSRRATSTLDRPRLRALRSRRLAVAARRDRGDGRRACVGDAWLPRAGRALAASSTASRPKRWRVGGRARERPSCRISPSPARRSSREALRRTLHRDRRDDAHEREGRRDGRVFHECSTGGRGVGGSLSERRAAEAADSRSSARGVGDAKRAASREWLFEECYTAVGDLAETITLLLPETRRRGRSPASRVDRGPPARRSPAATRPTQREAILGSWRELAGTERFVWNKLITGGFRVGVSQPLVIRALSRASGIAEGVIAHRLTGTWEPTRRRRGRALVAEQTTDADISRPYPFYLAYALEDELETLGDAAEWQAEWKWDGIRAQLIRRDGQNVPLVARRGARDGSLSRRSAAAAEWLPDGTVLDGEIMPWKDGQPLPFAQLQRRIGRKTLGAKILEEVPVVLVVYDLLEVGGQDVRDAAAVVATRAGRRAVA